MKTNSNDLSLLYQKLDINNPIYKDLIELVEMDLVDFEVHEDGQIYFFLTSIGKEVAETI
jgi:hypothetical protein